MTMRPFRHLAAALLALAGLPALAVNYTFPGSMPAGCSGSAGTYTCGALTLGFNDTVTISGVTPATITVNGNLTTNNARINQGGSVSNLTLTVNGTLQAEFQAVINAHVNATVVNGSGSELTFGGNIATTTGAISIGYNSTVAGNITSTTGAISIGGINQIAGQIDCNCTLEAEHNARIAGNVTAARFIGDGQVFMQGSITTTGSIDIGYSSTLGGAVTAGTTLRLRGNIQAPQCLRSTSSSEIRLDWADRANGGVCCGSLGTCSTSCVNNGSGAAMPSLCSGSPPSTPPSRFNAFETSTPAGSITGVIRTKVSGTSFTVAAVAVNSAGTGVATSFTGDVRVEILDASNNTGALNSATNCRSSWGVASGTSSATLSFAAADAGRKNLSFTVSESFRDARIRISYPATGTATVIGCSTDNFAIRPDRFALAAGATGWASDADSSTAGTGRQLDNAAATGGRVHRAGQPFTLRAVAVNSASATTTNYTGTPSASMSTCSGTACTPSFGTLTVTPVASAGVIQATASYSEAGAFSLQLADSGFASVDASDGSSAAELTIGSTAYTIGRFVPDHFDIVNLQTPVLRTFNSTCVSRSFTYLGQPFGYATPPQASVLARNAAGATTTLYPNGKLAALSISSTFTPSISSTPGLDSSGASTPSLAVVGSGIARLDGQATDSLSMVRSATTPAAPFSASIGLTWSVSDGSESGVTGNGTIGTATALSYSPIGFDAGATFRYGQLRLGSAYGSELLPLAVPIETQHWNGTGFVTNTADSCTALPTSTVSLANFRGGLAACETAPTATSVILASGRAVMRLTAPGNGNAGSVDATLQLGASLVPSSAVRCAAVGAAATAAVAANLPWLQSRAPGGSTYDQNPSARFSFGQHKSPLIRLREMY